jgi:uncharacterized RDD family membrane protein YckC
MAFMIDYLIMFLYIILLATVSLFISFLLEQSPSGLVPIRGQFIGFFSLTLPVIAYFYLFEKGISKGSIGKQKMGIVVVSGSNFDLLIRNILKFLPWEIAHTGVHWMVFYQLQELTPPNWVWVLLIIPQLVAFSYFVSIFLSGGKTALYDKISGTYLKVKA